MVDTVGVVSFLLKLGLTGGFVFLGLAPSLVELVLFGLTEEVLVLIGQAPVFELPPLVEIILRGCKGMFLELALCLVELATLGLTVVESVFLALALSLIVLDLLGLTEGDFVFLALARSLVALDLVGLTKVDFVFLVFALCFTELDLLGLTEVDLVFLGLALCFTELVLLGLKDVDFIVLEPTPFGPELDLLRLARVDFLVAINLLELTEGPTPASHSPDLLRLTALLVFFGDVTSPTAPGSLRGTASLAVFLSLGLSFSNLRLLGVTVRVSVSGGGSGFVSVLLVFI